MLKYFLFFALVPTIGNFFLPNPFLAFPKHERNVDCQEGVISQRKFHPDFWGQPINHLFYLERLLSPRLIIPQ